MCIRDRTIWNSEKDFMFWINGFKIDDKTLCIQIGSKDLYIRAHNDSTNFKVPTYFFNSSKNIYSKGVRDFTLKTKFSEIP